jgi:hypothetical protein
MVEKKYLIPTENAKQEVMAEINVILGTFSLATLEALRSELCAKCPQGSLDMLLRLREFGS